MEILVALLFGAACGWIINYYFANKILTEKGYDRGAISASFWLNWFAIVFAAGMPDLIARRKQDEIIALLKQNSNNVSTEDCDESDHYTTTIL